MSNERWEKLQAIFHEALEIELGERNSYLAEVCADDHGLKSEIEQLLSAYETGSKLLDKPALEHAELQSVSEESRLLSDQVIGNYQIGERIGVGGMGDVYLAVDTSLGRTVAVKFLKSQLLNDDWARKQLEREAKAVALLEHKNICTVYGFEEMNGHRFIAMQYIRGESLASMIEAQTISADWIFHIIDQIVEAIALAHSKGIIHRDIKPGNILVQENFEVKVLDFGLAKIVHDGTGPTNVKEQLSNATKKGVILGTVAYMSPEQVRSQPLGCQTDVFSLGTVIYEIITARHPFERKNDFDTMTAITAGDVSFTEEGAKKIRPGLRRLIEKCLDPVAERRYTDAGELLRDLRGLKESRSRELWSRYWKWAACFLLLIAMLAGIYVFLRQDRIYNVAILPFSNQTNSANYDYLAEGLAESMSGRLAESSGFRAVPYAKVSGLRSTSDATTPPIGISADLILAGRLFLDESTLKVETKLIQVQDGSLLRVATHEIDLDDIPSIEERVLARMFESLELRPFTAIGLANATKSDTKNNEAFRQYLAGRHLWRKRDPENLQKAITAFQSAIDLDPGYARAYAGLADCYVLMSSVAYNAIPTRESYARARAAARQAVEIDPDNAEGHTSLGFVLTKHDWNWLEAEREYKRAIEIDPQYGSAYYWLSGLLSITGRAEESIAAAEKAKELDPFSPLVEYNLSRTYYFARQYEHSLEILQRQTITTDNDTKIRYQYGLIYLQLGRFNDALAAFQEVSQKNKLLATPVIGYTFAKMGRTNEARRMIAELNTIAKTANVPPQEYAIIHIGLLQRDEAFRYLSAAYEERYGSLSAIKVEPLFDPIRNDPRFQELLKKMQLV